MKGGKMTYTGTNDQTGYLRGEPIPAYFMEIQKLSREDRLDEAINSLLALIDATEEDDLFTVSGVESAYYVALAQIYRKRKEYLKEIKILARYDKRRHVYGDSRQEILKERLEEAKKLLSEIVHA
jgi:MoxR-like ATPase